jgi:hypothetical protein
MFAFALAQLFCGCCIRSPGRTRCSPILRKPTPQGSGAIAFQRLVLSKPDASSLTVRSGTSSSRVVVKRGCMEGFGKSWEGKKVAVVRNVERKWRAQPRNS